MKRWLAALACALVAGLVQAQDKACGKADAAAAEKNVDMVVGWSQLHKVWRDYRHCDSGNVDEIFTDAVLRLMVEWRNVDALAAAMADPQFKAFVVKHLKSPAAKADQDAIYSRTKASCPPSHAAMCAELSEIVKRPAVKAEPPQPPAPPSPPEPPAKAAPPGK